MSDQPNWHHQTSSGRSVRPGGPFNNHSYDEQERHRTGHPQPAMHYTTNNYGPRQYAQNIPERRSVPSSGRSQRSDPQHDELPGARATTASGSTYRQQVGSDSVHRSNESNLRSPQRPLYHDAFDGGRSIANATTRSSSPSRYVRDAPRREWSGRGPPRSQDYLPEVGTQFPSEIEVPPGFSVTGSPPSTPSGRPRHEDHDCFVRQEDDHRIARSEVYERHGRIERYDHFDYRRR
ncbi:hypothetical protein Q7P36_003222 [Cladosporium allicinum]